MVSRETLRRWLVAAHLWQPGRRRCRRQRPRRERFGQLVQFDGSLHHRLEDRDAASCLMVMVDDATNHAETFMARGEMLEAAFTVLRRWIERHGVPKVLAQILCREESRRVDRDGTISIASQRWRLKPAPRPGSRVSLRRTSDGRIVVLDGQRRLQCLEGYR